MVDYDYKGIEISAVTDMIPMEYHDTVDKKRKMRMDRYTRVHVSFWDYRIYGSNSLYELCTIQSILQFFLQCYWKRSSKEGVKIELLDGLSSAIEEFDLFFAARQKDKQHFLHVCLKQQENTINEAYFAVREVSALEKAIGKAISLLSPRLKDHDYGWGC